MNLIKINEVYEIIGVLSYDFHESNTIETPENFESFNSQYPLNLIPRVHCLTLRKLSEAEQENNSIAILSQKLNNKFLNMLDLQKKLMNLLNQVTCGDELTSQYLLFGILNNAQISKKPEFLENIRKLNINIYKTSKVRFLTTSHEEITFSTLLTKLFEKITSKSVYLALSLEDLEKKHYVSKKNYENNRLEIGKLQMTENTMICIDETHMSAGKLTEVGLRNLNFLNDFIENQMLQFDFSYHEIKVPCSCNIIVCSEGKTFLKANINV